MKPRTLRSLRHCARGALVAILSACGTPAPVEPPTASAATPDPASLTAPTSVYAALPPGWTDESALMAGLCFESVWDAAGRRDTFMLRSPDDLNRLYDLADQSGLCRRPVRRAQADFGGGRVIAGTWTRGRGCDAQHVIREVRRDDVARLLALTIDLRTTGNCPYDLVRPFWIGLPGLAGYDIRLIVASTHVAP
ncbi:MAG: hypothetical protein NZM00_05455 [Anaerolinea sp.]|nr:hypothetical protein [Anaerolinea sp.]